MTPSTTPRPFDLIALGRAAVDLYANEVGTRLEDATVFAKYLGGSSGNIAYGAARQGLKVSMLTRVGDDHMGRFVLETFERVGVDTSAITRDPGRLTGLAILSVKTKELLPLLFYRKDCADMGLREEHIEESHIASARALVLTGTHLSQEGTRKASLKAIRFARANGVKVILDIDYRPVLWGLTSLDAGHEFFVASKEVSEILGEVLPLCDVIVGTEEETQIAGGSEDLLSALKNIRAAAPAAVLITKRGAKGAQVSAAAIPTSLDDLPLVPGNPVDVLSTVGAGDGFMSGLLRGFLDGDIENPQTIDWKPVLGYANACGALVVSRHGCSPASPTRRELDAYLALDSAPVKPDQTRIISHLHRVSARKKQWDQIAILAFDHRIPFEEYLRAKGYSEEKLSASISALKKHILQAFYTTAKDLKLEGRAGILCDDTYGQDVLNDITGKDFLITRPSESSRSIPLRFEVEENGEGSLGRVMGTWPLDHVVKCLFFIDPQDDPALMADQVKMLQRLYADCRASGRELMLEWLPPEGTVKTPEMIGSIMKTLYEAGIYPDWWKLLMESAGEWQHATAAIEKYDSDCRGILVLGAGNALSDMENILKLGSAQRLARGFAVGRTIFKEPAEAWLDGKISEQDLIKKVSANYRALIAAWGRFA